jgi:hypothetical protein
MNLSSSQGSAETGRTPSDLPGLAAFEAILDRCQALRYEDPKQMVDLALLATIAAGQLSPRRYGARRVAGAQCRAWIELANAYRVADKLDESEVALDHASDLFAEGEGDELLEARLHDVRASLLADRRRFDEACAALDVVIEIHERLGHPHLTGRALISKGVFAGYAGRPEEGILHLREGLARIDPQTDLVLVYAGLHNQAFLLLEMGRFREARALLWENRQGSADSGGRINLLKLRALEARADTELGDLDRAEEGFREVRQGFAELDLPYKAALASLELALVHHRRGDLESACARVVEAAEAFAALRLPQPALAAVLVARQALEDRREALRASTLLPAVIDFLAGAEGDPAADFEGWMRSRSSPAASAASPASPAG